MEIERDGLRYVSGKTPFDQRPIDRKVALGDWSEQLRNAVRSVADLLARLNLSPGDLEVDVDPEFPVRVPEAYLNRIEVADLDDPLLLQVLPRESENLQIAGYELDALDERSATVAPGLIQKYQGRALIIAAPSCAVHCRYCFRRSFPYADHRLGPEPEALEALANDTNIREVILSGGDPLMLKDPQLEKLVAELATLEHVERLRIHTRLPVVIPDRVTDGLVGLLRSTRLGTAVVVHINHANEIDRTLIAALDRLAAAGVQLLNQSVLLAGVNDDVESLADLSELLFKARVLPYYLHLLDKVTGTQHFDVPLHRARSIHAELRRRLPGYLVPRLVREIPGEGAKRWL